MHITRVEDRTYYAEIHLQHGGTLVNIDARPSDSIAIALRLGAPIFAAEELLVDPGDERRPRTTTMMRRRISVSRLSPARRTHR